MTRLSDNAVIERANSLCNEACFAVALQHRRLSGVKPEDEVFIFRWWWDLQFFIVALCRLRRSAEIAAKFLPLVQVGIDEFEKALPDLVKMRNVGEHIDDYVVDKGRDKYVDRRQLQVGELDGGVFIHLGGSLNIDGALEAAEKLTRAVRAVSRGPESGFGGSGTG